MKHLNTAIFAFLLLTGCGQLQRVATNITGDLTYKCSKSGVEYVQSDSGIAVHVDRCGKPVSCGEGKKSGFDPCLPFEVLDK
jgi:hypothetical protein